MRALVVIAAIAACRGDHNDRGAAHASTQILVSARAPGKTASDIETSIVDPLEDAFARLPGLVTIRSASRDGAAVVTLDFDGEGALAIADRVRRAIPLKQLPGDMSPPTVAFAPGPIALRYIVRWVAVPAIDVATAHRTRIIPALEHVDGVSRIETCGETDVRAEVRIDMERLAVANATVLDVVAALRAARDLRSIQAVRSIELADRVRVGDVADVEDAPAPVECHAIARDDSAIEGIVYAQSRADVAAVHAAATRALHDAAATLPRGMLVDVFAPVREVAIEPPPGADAAAREQVAMRAGKALGQRDALVELHADRVRALVADRDGVTLFAQALPGVRVFDDDGTGTWIRVRGGDLDVLARELERVASAAEAVTGITIVERELAGVEADLAIERDPRAADAGVDERAFADTVRVIGDGVTATTIHGDAPRDVVVRATLHLPHDLPRLLLPARNNARVPLATVARAFMRPQLHSIFRFNRQRVASLRVRFADDDARAALRARLAEVSVPAGYAIDFDGVIVTPTSPSPDRQ